MGLNLVHPAERGFWRSGE